LLLFHLDFDMAATLLSLLSSFFPCRVNQQTFELNATAENEIGPSATTNLYSLKKGLIYMRIFDDHLPFNQLTSNNDFSIALSLSAVLEIWRPPLFSRAPCQR
jgi:hypothetical protein